MKTLPIPAMAQDGAEENPSGDVPEVLGAASPAVMVEKLPAGVDYVKTMAPVALRMNTAAPGRSTLRLENRIRPFHRAPPFLQPRSTSQCRREPQTQTSCRLRLQNFVPGKESSTAVSVWAQ